MMRIDLIGSDRSRLLRILARGADSPYARVFAGRVDVRGAVALFELQHDADTWRHIVHADSRMRSTPTRLEPCPADIDDLLMSRQVSP